MTNSEQSADRIPHDPPLWARAVFAIGTTLLVWAVIEVVVLG